MNTATLTYRDRFSDAIHTSVVEDDSNDIFYAKVVGAIKGIVNGEFGSTLLNVETSTGFTL